MKFEIELNEKSHTLELAIDGASLHGSIDSRPVEATAVQIAAGVYSVLLRGQVFEIRVEASAPLLRAFVNEREYWITIRDPRQWRRDRGAVAEAQGRQKLTAPMPGKIVRLLVAKGARVEAGQGVVVVEAMKMQNEVRSPKSGFVEALLVTEGQAVNAGDTLGYIA